MVKGFLLLLAAVTVMQAKPPPPTGLTCPAVLVENGLDDYFGVAVSHRLHSLTLEDLRYYFKKDAPVKNYIPTINFDLSPNSARVLPHAPLNGHDTTFKTIALQHADMVLSNMDSKDWQIKYYSTLEKMVHTMHMSEMWEEAKEYYEGFLASPPSEKLCICVRDIKENGIMAELQLLALKIKFPGLTSGNPDLPYGKNADSKRMQFWYGFSYRFSYGLYIRFSAAQKEEFRKFEKKLKAFNFDGDEDEVVARAMKELQDDDKGLSKHLDSEEGWQDWKKGMKDMGPDDNRQFAMFIYCMLNNNKENIEILKKNDKTGKGK